MKVLANIFYSGIVQGVGFRYTAQRFAQELDLVGWAKNLPDGRVEIMAEGDKDTILKFMKQLETQFDGSIRGKEALFHSSAGHFKNFFIA